MPLPAFDRGFLPPDVHLTTIDEVLARFAAKELPGYEFSSALASLDAFAQQTHAEYYLIGGSFVSDQKNPKDLDIILVYRTKAQRPNNRDLDELDARLDIQVTSLDEPTIAGCFVQMYRFTRKGHQVGVCRVNVEAKGEKLPEYEANEAILEMLVNAYGARGRPRPRIVKRGVLVTIHGIQTHADWNLEVTRFASAQGWTVAPFVYGWRHFPILLTKQSRLRVVNQFRVWLDQLQQEEAGTPISVIAHSLGTYIFASCLFGSDRPVHNFAGVVLANPILSPDLKWPDYSESVRKILHDRAPNDGAVPWMTLVSYLDPDPYFGNAAVTGFRNCGDVVEEREAQVYGHSSALLRDVIRGRWIPFLNAYG